MKVLVLPGYSIQNRDWAIQVAEYLKSDFDTKVIEWEHWNGTDNGGLNVSAECLRIENEMGDEKVNLVAKSIGTLVSMQLLQSKKDKIAKVILLGIPTTDLSETDKQTYQVLAAWPIDKLMVIQNMADNHGSADQVQQFLTGINGAIKVLVKDRADHEYPYLAEFADFLK
ncbi:MAG: alpha/beta fold hydrolase [bacterium]|nr:alpha/beta fold hydrolase [bacterium]